MALACAAAQAQALPGGAVLGMTVQQLQQAVPALRPVARPAHLAGGLTGSWSGPSVDVAGVALTPTFYFAEAQLRRVEYVTPSHGGSGEFNALLAWARAAWGPELASQSPDGVYATWADEAMDVYLQLANPPQRAQVRLVVKHRQVKDAGEL
jgi:hypothetical protein